MKAQDRIIVALDVDSLDKVTALVEPLVSHVGCFKVGLELLMSTGAPEVVGHIHRLGGKVFLDGKFNDIPNTIGSASRAASQLGVQFFDVHASSGIEGMKAAVANRGKSKVLAVTVLTSMDTKTVSHLFGANPDEKVLQWAQDARDAGVDGIVCSPRELKLLSEDGGFGKLLKVTPGVRPAWASAQDQKRVMTPSEAVKAGADFLVIGRPIVQPPKEIRSPLQAVQRIIDEIESLN